MAQPSAQAGVSAPYAGPAGAVPGAPGVQSAQSATSPRPADGALPRRTRKTPAQSQAQSQPASQLSAVAGPMQHQDAVAVRDALEEYEAGVEQARRESVTDLPSRRQSARFDGPGAPQRDGDHD